MNTVLLQKSTKAVAWLMAASMAIAFAAPQAAAFQQLPRSMVYEFVSQSGTVSADGLAHEVAANPGDTVSLSLTVKNRSQSAAGQVWYGKSELLVEPDPYVNAHAIGVGTARPFDNTPSWLDSSSFVINGNRFTYYDGAAINTGGTMTLTWNVKISSTAANGTYDLYAGLVREWDEWGSQWKNGKVLPNPDIFWRVLVGGTITGGGDLNVATASTTPAAGNVAIGAVDVVMAQITFSAGASDNALVSSIAVRRTNLSADDDVGDIKIYDGATKLGSTQGLNTTTHKATFTGLAWLIPAGTSRTLTIKGTVLLATADTGKIISLGIESASDITLSGGGVVAGTFPAYGNGFTVGGITAGQFNVDVQTTPAAANVLSGSTDQAIASWKFAATATEGFDVTSITFDEIGTSADADVSNLKLKINGVQVGSTVASLSGSQVTFTGSPIFSVTAGQSEYVYLYCDVAADITSARTIRFEINDSTDVVARGQNSMASVTITYNGGTAFVAQQGLVMTIVQGTLTVTEDPTNLTDQTYIIGEPGAEVSKLKFSAGSREGMKVTKLIFNLDGTSTASSTDFQNAKLYINDSATPIATGGSVSTTTITFEDGNGLFEIAKSGNTVVTLKVDISSSASDGETILIGLGTASTTYTAVTAYGLTSGEKIPQDSDHITLTSCSDGDAATHTISQYGTLVVSSGPNTPAAANYALGTVGYEFLQFRMTAGGESMRVTAVTVRFYDDNSATDAYAAGDETATGDVTNAKLYYWDGAAWVMLGNEIASPTTGITSFTFDHTIAKNTTETYKVVADIPTTSAASYIYADVGATTGATTGVTTAVDVITTGVYSAAAIAETGSADGTLMTKVAPIVTVLASTVPAAHSVVLNADDELLGQFFLQANDVEDIKVSTIKIWFDQDAGNMASTSNADTDLANVYLRFDDGGTWRTTITKNVTTGAIDYVSYSGGEFNTPSEWLIPKGGSMVVEVRGDITGTDSATLCVGMTAAATNVVAAGLNSGTAATIYDYELDAYNQIWESPELTLASGGTLAIVAATDTPTVQQVTASYGSTVIAPAFFRAKLSATNESIVIDALRARVADQGSAGEDDNFAGPIRIYEGGTMSGNTLTGGTLVGSGTLYPVSGEDAAADIVFTTPVTIANNSSKYLTIVADLNSVTGGADSGDVPYIGIDYNVQTGIWTASYANKYNVRATGVSSNGYLYTAATAILKGNAVYVTKTKLGMAVNSASPSGTATRQANHTIMKLNLTNTSADTDARFRAGAHNAMTALTTDFTGANTDDGAWTESGNGTIAASAVAYIDSGKSLLVTTGVDTNPTVLFTFSGAQDLSGYTGMGFWSNASDASEDLTLTLTGAGAGSHTINAGTNDAWEFFFVPFASADTPFTGLTAITAISIAGAGVTAGDTFYLDSFVLYKDYMKMSVTSNAGLWANTGLTTSPPVYLKDASSGTTLATGYLAGTYPTTFVSTSQGDVYWFPTTEMAIPASGKTYNVVVDTTVFITATSRDLTMSIDLGSASSAGAITAGSVLWNDNSATAGIGWVDSPDSPLARGLNF